MNLYRLVYFLIDLPTVIKNESESRNHLTNDLKDVQSTINDSKDFAEKQSDSIIASFGDSDASIKLQVCFILVILGSSYSKVGTRIV